METAFNGDRVRPGTRGSETTPKCSFIESITSASVRMSAILANTLIPPFHPSKRQFSTDSYFSPPFHAIPCRLVWCDRRDARPYTADIGLVGKAVGKYTILVGGRLLGNRLNVIYKDMVPLREVVQELVPLLVYYFKADREPGESWGDFCHRKGVAELLRFDAEYQSRAELIEAHI